MKMNIVYNIPETRSSCASCGMIEYSVFLHFLRALAFLINNTIKLNAE